MTLNIAFVLYPEFEELDFAGPYEVFGAARKMLGHDWDPFTVAIRSPVQGAHGLSVNPDHLVSDAPPADILVVPGGQSGMAISDDALMAYVREAGARAQLVASVCTGAFVLHRAGLLRGKRATTYWAAVETLRRMPEVEAVGDRRWVHDGKVVTAAGVSAGIDMALYVIGHLLSPKDARAVQQYLEYYPAPPYAACAGMIRAANLSL